MAALLLRANLTVAGLMERSTIIVDDYRVAELPLIKGKTLFIGNPPYVRHHLIDADAKRWFADTAAGFGVKASKQIGRAHVELQSLMRISYAVFCLKKKNTKIL